MAYMDLKNISYTYPDGTEALSDLSLTIGKGEKVVFLGENGSGKSTLFLFLCGLIKADKGSYLLDGKKAGPARAGMTFQNPEVQLFAPTVFQEVSFGPMNLGLKKEDVKKRVYDAMNRTGISSLKDRPVQYLSYLPFAVTVKPRRFNFK